jgi:formate dehydrogenase maturation protein FdhE
VLHELHTRCSKASVAFSEAKSRNDFPLPKNQPLTLLILQAAVHLDCYRRLQYPTGPWRCEVCQEMPLDAVISSNQSGGAKARLVQCGLCHGTAGAFRKTLKGQWVHAFCAEVPI